jgi:zinc protease
MRRLLITFLGLLPWTAMGAAEPSVHEYQLDNGLKIIVKEDHRAPVVFSSIWYKVGGSYEPSGITGISHALEHMMFRGTGKYGPGQFDAIINANGGDQNAMTGADYTIYYQSIPAAKLAQSFEMEADRMTNLTLDPALFAKEIQIVMEERRMRTDDNPQALMLERINATAFINNPYHQPIIGWMSDLQQMTAKDLRDWYQKWYVPNNAVIVVAGDVKPDAVFALAKKYFGGLQKRPLPEVKPLQEVPALGVRRLNLRIPAKMPWVVLAYNTPSLTTAAESTDPYTLTVLAGLLGSGNSSRLSHDLVRGQQTAVSADAEYDLYNLHDNLLTISATPAKNISSEDLQRALQQEVSSLQNNLVKPEELARTKALLIAQHVFDQDSRTAQAMNLAIPEVTGLSWRKESEFISGIEKVTAQQIQAAAKRYLIPDNLTIAILEPISKSDATVTEGEAHDSSTVH